VTAVAHILILACAVDVPGIVGIREAPTRGGNAPGWEAPLCALYPEPSAVGGESFRGMKPTLSPTRLACPLPELFAVSEIAAEGRLQRRASICERAVAKVPTRSGYAILVRER